MGGAGAERLGIRFEVATGGDFFTAMLSALSLLGDLLIRGFGTGLCAVDGHSAPNLELPSSTPSTKSLAGNRRISTKDAEVWTREKNVKLFAMPDHTYRYETDRKISWQPPSSI